MAVAGYAGPLKWGHCCLPTGQHQNVYRFLQEIAQYHLLGGNFFHVIARLRLKSLECACPFSLSVLSSVRSVQVPPIATSDDASCSSTSHIKSGTQPRDLRYVSTYKSAYPNDFGELYFAMAFNYPLRHYVFTCTTKRPARSSGTGSYSLTRIIATPHTTITSK